MSARSTGPRARPRLAKQMAHDAIRHGHWATDGKTASIKCPMCHSGIMIYFPTGTIEVLPLLRSMLAEHLMAGCDE